MFKPANSILSLLISLFLSALSLSSGAQTAANSSSSKNDAQLLPGILDKHFATMGDFSKIQSRRVKLKIVGMAPFTIPTTVEAKRPNLIRREVALQGNLLVTAYDGKDAWKIDPFLSSGQQPIDLPKDELPALIEEAFFDGLLPTAKAQGHAIEYLRQEKIDGQAAHVLKVNIPTTGETTIYLDANTFLEIKRLQRRMAMGKMSEIEVISSDYRLQDGGMLPFRFDIGPSGSKQKMQMLIESISLNPALDVGRFKRGNLP